MKETAIKELDKVISVVLEEWSMMLTENTEADSFELSDEKIYYKSIASFSGASKGEITIICPDSFLKVLAENLLDLDEEESSEQDLKDCLQELTNIVSGNFLSEYFGTELVFDLPDFKVGKLDNEEVEEILSQNEISYLMADDEPVCTFCKIE